MTDLVIDPSVAGPGSGTLGDPHASNEYAILNNAYDTANGTRLWTRSTVPDVLSADLSVALATAGWAVARDAPIFFGGFTNTLNDGGRGAISGGGLTSILDDTSRDFATFHNMKIGDVGPNFILNMGNDIVLNSVEAHDSDAEGVSLDFDVQVLGSLFHRIALRSLLATGNQLFAANTFDNTGTTAIDNTGNDGYVLFNIIRCAAAASGIALSNEVYAMYNAIASLGGSGKGIFMSSPKNGVTVVENILRGFSGSGGVGMDFSPAGSSVRVRAGNLFYDNETHSIEADVEWPLLDPNLHEDQILTFDPFVDAANGDFRVVSALREASVLGDFYS